VSSEQLYLTADPWPIELAQPADVGNLSFTTIRRFLDSLRSLEITGYGFVKAAYWVLLWFWIVLLYAAFYREQCQQ